MQRPRNLENCPFIKAKEEVRIKFLDFETVLNRLQNQLFDEIDRFQREWEEGMTNFQRFRLENIVMKTLEPNLNINPYSKPSAKINWSKSMNLFQLTYFSKIAHITWLNQSIEDDYFQRERSVPVYLDLQRGEAHSMRYIDTDATPVSDQNFSYEHLMMKKSMSTDFNSQPNNYENVRFAGNSDQIPSSRASTGNNSYASDRELDARGDSCMITYGPNYCSLNVPNINREDKPVSRSAPQSPTFRHRSYTRDCSTPEHIKFCDPRERDVLLTDNAYNCCNSPVQPCMCYTRQRTVIKNPEWRTRNSGFTESQDGIVNQMVRKFQDHSI